MGFYSQYYYDWTVFYVEGICDVIDFILLKGSRGTSHNQIMHHAGYS